MQLKFGEIYKTFLDDSYGSLYKVILSCTHVYKGPHLGSRESGVFQILALNVTGTNPYKKYRLGDAISLDNELIHHSTDSVDSLYKLEHVDVTELSMELLVNNWDHIDDRLYTYMQKRIEQEDEAD